MNIVHYILFFSPFSTSAPYWYVQGIGCQHDVNCVTEIQSRNANKSEKWQSQEYSFKLVRYKVM